jgi:hypothetical protein
LYDNYADPPFLRQSALHEKTAGAETALWNHKPARLVKEMPGEVICILRIDRWPTSAEESATPLVSTNCQGCTVELAERWASMRTASVWFNDRRHTPATQIPQQVSELARRATIIMLDTYNHAPPSMGKEIEASIDRILAATTAAS